MKVLTILLLIASVALNVFFFAGCKSLHDFVYDDPCKYSDGGKEELVRIAESLGIKTAGKSSSDLSSDICIKLERNVEVPMVFNSEAFEKMAEIVNSEAEDAMRKYQQFISDLQGKRVIVIERED